MGRTFGDTLKEVIRDSINSEMLTDFVIGTVVTINPLSVKIDETLQPIPEKNLVLANSVILKTIDNVKHKHSYFDSDTGDGASGSQTRQTDEQLTNIQVYENGKPLGYTQDGKIIMNKGLEINDVVIMLRTNHGQRFIILSRLY